MQKFEVTILGCGSALPTTKHHPSSQVINFREKLMMIDCAEGSQLQFRKAKFNFNKITHLFLSHLHGDHCFGIPGMISTMGLLGHRGTLHIHAHQDAEKVFRPVLDYFAKDLPFQVEFHSFNPFKQSIIYQDKSLIVETIPLKHRIPCCGFLFREVQGKRHIDPEMAQFYNVPRFFYNSLKEGDDYVTSEGVVIPNSKLTKEPTPVRSYAYCADTAYKPDIVDQIKGVDLLYHESTFTEEFRLRAKETNHSTAKEAAMIASQAGVKALLLGHYSARIMDENQFMNEAKEYFSSVRLAQEMETYTL